MDRDCTWNSEPAESSLSDVHCGKSDSVHLVCWILSRPFIAVLVVIHNGHYLCIAGNRQSLTKRHTEYNRRMNPNGTKRMNAVNAIGAIGGGGLPYCKSID